MEETIKIFLSEAEIPFLTVYGRVKTFDSFYEKIGRKSYEDPFDQTEDFVGIRIIVYFPTDIDEIVKILKNEFIVEQSEDKSQNLGTNEFGYRSHHCIVKINPDWGKTPNYRGLERIKAEVQVRTVLMHAWAEVEHKLQYKHKDQVPRELQRKLFLLSAKFEEADQQFEDIRTNIKTYNEVLSEKIRKDGAFDTGLELNLDTFKQFLAFFYPNSERHDYMASDEFELVVSHGLDFPELVRVAKEFQPLEGKLSELVSPLTQAAVFSYSLNVVRPDVTDKIKYSKNRLEIISDLASAYKDA